MLSPCAYKTLSSASSIFEYLIREDFRCFETGPLLFFYSNAVLNGKVTISTLLSPFQGSKGDPGVVGPMGPAGLPVSMGVRGIRYLQCLFPR